MAGLTDILTALQNGVTAIQTVAQKLSTAFPGITTSSTSAPATNGAITFSSSLAAGFMLVTTSSGATVKVATYNQ
jgi:hypothetical protein